MLFLFNLKRIHRNAADGRRRGFTLIELLVVLTVMVTLGGMLTYALASAATEARLKRTQADVLTIGQLLQTRMNEISLSKVELVFLQPAALSGSTSAASGPGTGGTVTIGNLNAQEQSRLVLAARRDLLRMVLPECRADLLYPPASLPFRSPVGGSFRGDVAQVKPPVQWNRMRTLAGLPSSGTLDELAGVANPTTDPAVDAIEVAFDESASVPAFVFPFNGFALDYVPPGGGTSVRDTIYDDPAIPVNPGEPDDRFWSRDNESAECLYLILATTELFGQKAIDRVSASSIGDTDGDGFLEILDAWGTPYEVLRSPSGIQNRAVKNFVASGSTIAEQYPPDLDPFDFLLADFRYDQSNFTPTPMPSDQEPYLPFYVPPVVLSAGPDREFGLRRTYWVDDDNNQNGVADFYSSSAVQLTSEQPAPRYPGMVYRFPDPFFNVSAFPISGPPGTPASFTRVGLVSGGCISQFAHIKTAREGGGLGGTIDRDSAADNISSLDGDI